MNSFYQHSKFIQWSVAIFFLLISLLIIGFLVELAMINPLYYLIVFFFVPIGQFLITPFFTLTGMYRYLSPMLLVFAATNKSLDLHNGTSFDYLFVMRKCQPGVAWRNQLLKYYLEGLLNIIQQIENKELPPEIKVRGSSYFFSESTAKRMGFAISQTPGHEKLNIYLNYIDLIWMYSFSYGKLIFPKVSEVKTAETTGEQLVQQKAQIIKFHTHLNSREIVAPFPQP